MFKRLVDFSSFEILGIVTTVLFFIAFIAILIRVLRLRSPYIESMEQLPLNDGTLTHASSAEDKD
ncbi:MAG TPA: hypothetical protein PK916_01845 [Bacteroidota bacterium]|nr:hypothetical protein [Bacteroidota bacterium]